MASPIETALALVLADLATTDLPLPRFEPSSWQTWEPSDSGRLFAADDSGVGVWLDLSLPEQQGLAHLADQVQDWAVEELCGRRLPTNWPPCATHPATHPLRADVVHGRAVWVCPRGVGEAVPLGHVRSA